MTNASADSRRIADDAVATWKEIDAILAPVVGKRGVAGLYRRSLFLTIPSHACLTDVDKSSEDSAEFGALGHALSEQPKSAARAASAAVLQAFAALLVSLIGSSLTAQLLQSVRGFPQNAHSEQDPDQ